uniref:ZAD domain-containing protein n=1 Tax=Anopheles stephensi TaxID=30069 RepID=A0A182YFB8_ANOST
MDYNISRLCRVCLEEGVFASIFSTDLVPMAPANMLVMCANIKVSRDDGLPSTICNNCMYRLGVAFHLKQQCENSDMRLRQYMNGGSAMNYSYTLDKETMTDDSWLLSGIDHKGDEQKSAEKKSNSRKRYRQKLPEERKKRGPKPMPKIPQTCYQCHKSFKCAAHYKCHECHKVFATLNNLNVHLRVHAQEQANISVADPAGELMPPAPPPQQHQHQQQSPQQHQQHSQQQLQHQQVPVAIPLGLGPPGPLGVGLGMLPYPSSHVPTHPPAQVAYHSQMHPSQRLHPY